MSAPNVSIIIVAFDNLKDIERCLRAISCLTYKSFEIIICENGGKTAFNRLQNSIRTNLDEGQCIELIEAPRNLGFAGGVNLAITRARASAAVWILNPDTEPDSDSLYHLVQRLARGDCDGVGCTIVLPSGKIQSYGGKWKAKSAHAESIGYGSNPRTVPAEKAVELSQNYLNGASMYVSQSFIDKVGLMREDYFLYCEEVEWFLRAKRLGINIGVSLEAKILHHHGTTTGFGLGIRGASRIAMYLSERNKLLVIWDTSPALIVFAASLSLYRLLLRCVRHRALRQLPIGIKGWLDGVVNVRRSKIPFI